MREHWGEMQGYLGNVLRNQGMNKAIAEEMAIIPGMEEVVSLLHINKQAEEGNFDRVIVDAAPTGETMRLLTMPESFQWYVGRLRGWGDTTLQHGQRAAQPRHARQGSLCRAGQPGGGRQGTAEGADRSRIHQLPRRAQSGEDGA